MDGYFERWAKDLLGADAWRNAAVATCEVGWSLTGAARGVREVALRRARLWLLPLDDPYRGIPMRFGGRLRLGRCQSG